MIAATLAGVLAGIAIAVAITRRVGRDLGADPAQARAVAERWPAATWTPTSCCGPATPPA